jgi:hypothetical protein
MGDGQRLHLERESIEGITQEFKEYNKYLKANFKVFISKYGVTADAINACDPYADITWEMEYYQLDAHKVRTFGQEEGNEMVNTIEYLAFPFYDSDSAS